jgi:PAS domain S-box-containing protein
MEGIFKRNDIPESIKGLIRSEIAEKSFTELADFLPEIVFELDLEGNFTYANQYLFESTGYTQEDINDGMNPSHFVIPNDRERVKQNIQKLIQGKKPNYTRYTALRKDGTTFPILVYSNLILHDTHPIAVRGMILDITDQIKAVEEQQKEKNLALLYLNIVAVIIVALDDKQRVTLINRKGSELLGYEENDIVGKNWFDNFIPQRLHEEIKPVYNKLMRGEIEPVKSYENPIVTKMGEERIIAWNNTILHDENGKIVGTLSSGVDITERKKTEEILQNSEHYLKEAQAIAQIGSWRLNPKTLEVSGSDELFRIFSLSREEATLEKFLEVVHPKDREFDQFHIRRGLEEGIPWDIEHRLLLGGRTLKYVQAKGEAITDNTGKVIQLVGTVQDITERKRTEKLKIELEERRDNFVWMTSHELRTPLTVILGYIDLLQRNLQNISHDQQEKILGIIRKNVRRLEKLTDQVSLIAQFKEGIFQITEKEFDFCTFLNEALEPYRNMLEDQIKFDESQIKQPLIIKGDQDRLLQVIDNLLNNAVKQTDPSTRLIEIDLEISPTVIRVHITDNGSGIAPENLFRIFEQFVSIQTKYSVTGTGIGLYLSIGIMNAHGGTITAHSKGTGAGSTFSIELPRKM